MVRMVQRGAKLHRRLLVAVALATVLAVAPFWWLTGAQGGATSTVAPQGIVVVGDSITARYNDSPGDAAQGWWSVVGRHYAADVRTYAQSGSGYLRPGSFCQGNRFASRAQAFEGTPPSLFIVEGGRNDWADCRGGRFVPSTTDAVRRAVDAYLTQIGQQLPASTRVLVLGPPWGPAQQLQGIRVTAVIREAAARHGFEFVDTAGTLTSQRVVDGVHPNRAGSLAIADRVISAIG